MVAGPSSVAVPATGDPGTSAWADGVGADVNFLIAPPIMQCYNSTAQSIANNTPTALTFDTNVFDTYSGHSTTTNTSRYTCQVAGVYRIGGACYWNGNATGVRAISAYKNGGLQPYIQEYLTPNASSIVNRVNSLIRLAVNDYVEMWVVQTSGAALSTVATGSEMTIEWISN